MENLNEFIKTNKNNLPTKYQAEFSNEIKTLAKDCTEEGLTSTIQDNSDKSSIYALLHCVKEHDGSVSISYAIHNMKLKTTKKKPVTELEFEEIEKYQGNMTKAMLQSLHENSGAANLTSQPTEEM